MKLKNWSLAYLQYNRQLLNSVRYLSQWGNSAKQLINYFYFKYWKVKRYKTFIWKLKFDSLTHLIPNWLENDLQVQQIILNHLIFLFLFSLFIYYCFIAPFNCCNNPQIIIKVYWERVTSTSIFSLIIQKKSSNSLLLLNNNHSKYCPKLVRLKKDFCTFKSHSFIILDVSTW